MNRRFALATIGAGVLVSPLVWAQAEKLHRIAFLTSASPDAYKSSLEALVAARAMPDRSRRRAISAASIQCAWPASM
jgi:hypothetical protein